MRRILRRLDLMALAAALLLSTACGGASKAVRSGGMQMTADSASIAPAAPPQIPGDPNAGPAMASANDQAIASAQATGGSALKPASKPLLIYIATLHLAVFEAVQSIHLVEMMARDRGGYLVKRTDTSITVRVPAEIFHATVEDVAKIGDVTHRDISAQDVTAEFRDLEVRLRNLEVVRERMAKLLEQSKNVQEALAVERELERITTQMEQIKGRLKLFSELVAFSTINVTFQARPAEKIESTVELPFPWLRDMGLPRLLAL